MRKKIASKIAAVGFAAALLGGLGATASAAPAEAGSYAGPLYTTKAKCEIGRVTYQSSFTRAGACMRFYGWDSNTRQDVYIGWSFTVTTREY